MHPTSAQVYETIAARLPALREEILSSILVSVVAIAQGGHAGAPPGDSILEWAKLAQDAGPQRGATLAAFLLQGIEWNNVSELSSK